MNNHGKYNELDRQTVLDVLNSLEVVESQGGDDTYILVENTPENRAKLNEVGVTDEQIYAYGDEDTFCILTLAFDLGIANDYENGKFVWREMPLEKEWAQTLIANVDRLPSPPEISQKWRSVAQAYLDALDEIERLREALETIESWTRNPREYEPSLGSINHTARQALEGVSK